MPPKNESPRGDEDETVVDLSEPEQEVTTREPGDAIEPRQNAEPAEPAEEPARETRTETRAEREEREDAITHEGGRRRNESEEDYSRRVRGRINRERALRMKSDRKVDNLTVQNNELRDRVAKLERKQSAETITSEAAKKISEINKKIEELKVRMAAAKEAGDTAKDLDMQIELADLIADRKVIERRSEFQAEQARQAAEQQTSAPGGDDSAEVRIARATRKWQDHNRKWWNLNRYRDIKQDAIELDKDLRDEVRDGSVDFEEYSDEYFAELSARLKQNYPDLDVRGLDGEPVEQDPEDVESRTTRDDKGGNRRREQPAPRRHPAGGMGTGDRRRGNGDEVSMAKQNRVRLTGADYAQMREYNLDPNNEAHVKRFAKERMRTILTEGGAKRGGGR